MYSEYHHRLYKMTTFVHAVSPSLEVKVVALLYVNIGITNNKSSPGVPLVGKIRLFLCYFNNRLKSQENVRYFGLGYPLSQNNNCTNGLVWSKNDRLPCYVVKLRCSGTNSAISAFH